MATPVVADAALSTVVLLIGLVMLIRRRAALGRRGRAAIAGVVLSLIVVVTDGVLRFASIQAITTLLNERRLVNLGWTDTVSLLVLPLDLAALPLLAWAIFAGRTRRPAVAS
ncbi:hypothetical protein [Dactylosporangium sp. CA-233914]|uniref:hypothetical protein n=1 Tax=Dactylosporangium sp. CA-233914 TaxID=3239934 RepID=UPI003D8C7753